MVKDGSHAERELEERLWNEGFSSFRVAGSGTVPHESADIVAIKNGHSFIFEVKSLKPDSFPYRLKEDMEQLNELRHRAQPGAVHAGFAIDIVGQDIWRWSSWKKIRVHEPQELEPLYKALNWAKE